MRTRIFWSAIFAALLLTLPVVAADTVEEHPGYFDVDDLGIVDDGDSSVDINLRGAMLRLVGAAVLDSEPELSDLVEDLELMRVLVAPSKETTTSETLEALGRGASRLDELGWQRVVRVRDEGEQVYVYVREIEGEIAGLTILVVDPSDETVLINMVGKIDVDLLASIGRAFDVPSLEEALAETDAAEMEVEVKE